MVEAAQVEQRLSIEPRAGQVEPPNQDGNGIARDGGRPAGVGGTDSQSSADATRPSDSVEISPEAQRIAANDPGNAPRTETPQADTPPTETLQSRDSSVDTAARPDFGPTVGGTTNDGAATNQFTNFQSERTGNDTQNETEAGRTLGQVIDTFA
jgi:hypothetical protein